MDSSILFPRGVFVQSHRDLITQLGFDIGITQLPNVRRRGGHGVRKQVDVLPQGVVAHLQSQVTGQQVAGR